MKKSWCVHAEPPTMHTDRIKEYLGKYICRIGLSKQRFKYDSFQKEVILQHKDYYNKNKETGITPMAIKKMHPLVAIHQKLQHCLPRYFQKCRYLGLHANAYQQKNKKVIPKSIRNSSGSIRTLFEILHAILGIEGLSCKVCKHDEHDTFDISKDHQWIHSWIDLSCEPRGSTRKATYHKSVNKLLQSSQPIPCPKSRLLKRFS